MTIRAYQQWALGLSAAGAAFSGYLSATKLLTAGCAFNEPCPYFFGIPACYIGFALFLTLFLISLIAFLQKRSDAGVARANLAASALGTLFAGYYVVVEVVSWFRDGFATYGLGLSTCTYGFVLFVVLLILSANAHRSAATPPPAESMTT